MTVETTMEKAATDIVAYGSEVTYTPDGGEAITCQGLFQHEKSDLNALGATITVKKSDVDMPGYRDTFTVDGEDWYVAMDGSKPRATTEGYLWSIELSREERNTAWRK